MTTHVTEAFIADLINTHPAVVSAFLTTNDDDAVLAILVRELCGASLSADNQDAAVELAERLAVAAGLDAEEAELDCQLREDEQARWKRIFSI